jgi:hypothetical protein
MDSWKHMPYATAQPAVEVAPAGVGIVHWISSLGAPGFVVGA